MPLAATGPSPSAAPLRPLPDGHVTTHQELRVDAPPAVVWDAVWAADLTARPLARVLASASWLPQRLAARLRGSPAPTAPAARLGAMLGPGSPWVLVDRTPPSQVVLALLWRPPAGGTKVAAGDLDAFGDPRYVKVLWSLHVLEHPDGGCTLATETRSIPLGRSARVRFELVWPFVALPAAVLRRLVLRAVRDEAQRRVAR